MVSDNPYASPDNVHTGTIDTRHVVETAEGARLQLTVAGPVTRGLAWSIDFAIRAILLVAMVIVLGNFAIVDAMRENDNASFIMGVGLLIYFAISSLYYIVFEASTGSTPGKQIFKLIVVHDNATPLSFGGSVIRNLLRSADILPMMYMFGLITTLCDNRFRRMGDLAAGTLVVYRDLKPDLSKGFAHTASAAPPNGLSREERLAIVDFAERSTTLSEERQHELASKLQHLMEQDADPVETLKRWAEWVLRGQAHA